MVELRNIESTGCVIMEDKGAHMVREKKSSTGILFSAAFIGLMSLTAQPAQAAMTTATPAWNGLMGLESASVADTGEGFSFSFLDTEIELPQDRTRAADRRWEASVQKKNKSNMPGGLDLAAAAASFKDARWCDSSTFPESRNSGSDNLLRMMRDTRSAAPAMNVNNFSSLNVGGFRTSANGTSSLREARPTARGAAVSYTMRPTKNWTFSLSNAFLKESNVLLGSPDSPHLGMGRTATASVGIGASVDLGRGYSLGVDTIAAATHRSYNETSPVSNASRLTSFGASVVLNKDNMGFTVQKPLKVYSGTGLAQGKTISLKPSGSETDFGFSYKKPMDFGGSAGFSLTYRHDADHVAGAKDGTALFHFSASF